MRISIVICKCVTVVTTTAYIPPRYMHGCCSYAKCIVFFTLLFSTHELFFPKLFHRPDRNNVSRRARGSIQCQPFLVWLWLCRYLPLHPLGCRQGPDLADSGSTGAQYIHILHSHAQNNGQRSVLALPDQQITYTYHHGFKCGIIVCNWSDTDITIAPTLKILNFCMTINFKNFLLFVWQTVKCNDWKWFFYFMEKGDKNRIA